MSANLYAQFRKHFPAETDAPFIHQPGGPTLTYGEVESRSAQLAAALVALGVQPGDRVAAQVEKSATALLLYLGCLRAGGVYLPLNTAYTGDELEYFLSDATPSVFMCDPARLAQVPDPGHEMVTMTLDERGTGTLTERAEQEGVTFETRDRNPDDLGALLYSSGTTGQPKGVMLSHGALADNADALKNAWQITSNDVVLHALPIFHTHGLFVATNTVLMSGGSMIFHPRFNPADVIRDLPHASIFMGVPTYYARLLRDESFAASACTSIRLFISGSAPLQDETFKAFTARTGHTIVERYGMTEAGIITSADPDRARTAGTVGFPLDGVSLRVCDDEDKPVPTDATGSVQIQSTGLFSGYWNRPDKTAEDTTNDGYFRTGDIGRLESDGQLTLVGRAKDMFISGGFNVYPKEIEQVIEAMDGVEESAVIGLPHPDFGEAGLALVVAEPGREIDPHEQRTALKATLANYKVPKLIWTVESLPRNAMGKVQKNVLRETFVAKWTAEISDP